MKTIFILFSLFGGATVFAGPMVGGGPASPQQQHASAFVSLGNVQDTGQPSDLDVDGCNAGTSTEARIAKSLATRRAKKMLCLHGGHPGQVEVDSVYAMETENLSWYCKASAVLPCN